MGVRALTLDLDDTLWPFAPVAERIRRALEGWLAEHAPRTHARYDPAAAQEAVEAVRRERTDLAHDIGEQRREALRRMLASCDEDPALADDALAIAVAARQRVDLYPDARPALDRLAARMPLLGLTNGNADPHRTGIAPWLRGVVSAAECGYAKPDPEIFRIACERLALPAGDVLHAGDDLHTDVAGALGAGLRAAWVHRDLEGETPPGVLRVRDLVALADALGA